MIWRKFVKPVSIFVNIILSVEKDIGKCMMVIVFSQDVDTKACLNYNEIEKEN